MNYRNTIIEIIESRESSVSAIGIAHYAEIDAPSEVLRDITDECWELVNEGVLIPVDRRGERHGGLFFRIAS